MLLAFYAPMKSDTNACMIYNTVITSMHNPNKGVVVELDTEDTQNSMHTV